MKKVLVTGGLGFIGGNLIQILNDSKRFEVLNIDCCTYAANKQFIQLFDSYSNYQHKKVDLCDYSEIKKIFLEYKPDFVMHLAAESHVDNSIKDPHKFINTNIIGTFNLLEASKQYAEKFDMKNFKFLHVSTDEVFGSLDLNEPPFNERNKYFPNSPYSASKASSDHLVRAYHKTFGLNCIVTNCSNNYGPFQHHEKLIPKVIKNALAGASIPVYGNGLQIRDWLYVSDHCKALILVLENGEIGDSYNIGGFNEIKNIDVINTICRMLDQFMPSKHGSYSNLIEYVKDRPGHDKRYAIDSSYIKNQLNWEPSETFESGISKTIKWYLANGI